MPQTPPLRQRALGLARKAATPRAKAAARRMGGKRLVSYERRGLTPELTVVIPVYNVQEYLPAALDSALTQSLHNLEVIAVDDGSTDGCLEILREYERRDPRVRVFTQTNSGQGIARNLGVHHARGEFLTFLDSDDTVPPRAYQHMVSSLRRSGSDFSVGGVRRFKHNEYIRTVWARTVHAADRIGVTIEEFPNAMQDIIACNRMFRTAFWREQVGDFRGHIAYEDHVPMLTAYVRAERFDILRRVTYNWRIRENLTSTGQQKARLENLLDRIAVKEEAHELLRAEASDFVYDTWVGRTLEVDFPTFIAYALKAPGSYRNILTATFQTYLGRATDRALDMVTVRQKIRAELVAQGRWDEIAAADAYFADIGYVPPAHVEDGLVVATVPADLPFMQGLPDPVLRLSPLESHFEGVVDHVVWGEDSVQVGGWAVRRGLSISGRSADFRAWLVCDDERIDVPVQGVVMPQANVWGTQQYARYDGGGFIATIDVAALPARTASWHLEVEVSYDGVTSSGPLLNRVKESASVRDSGIAHAYDGRPATVRARWHGAHGFSIDVDTDPVLITSLAVADGVVSGVLAVPPPRVAAVHLVHPDAAVAARTSGAPGAGTRFQVPLPLTADVEGGALWTLRATVDGAHVVPLWPDDLVVGPTAAAVWQPDADRGAALATSTPALAVTDVRLTEDTVQVRVEAAPGLSEQQARTIELGNPRLALSLIDVRADGPGWWLTYSLLTSIFDEAPHPAPSARYQLSLAGPTGVGVAHVAPSYAGRLPQRDHGTLVNLRVVQSPSGRFGLSLEPPRAPEAQGVAFRRQLRDRYRTAPVEPTDSVLFGCYRGEFATDSQLALDRALAEHRPELTRYWGVADASTEVPEGAVPLLLDSAEWYDALASSRFLSNNIDFGSFFRQRPHQRYLQTFHGYPFKSMGLGFWRSKGFTDEQLQAAVDRANREWDTILVPSEECVRYYREQYEFEGDILVAGYPRCDFLVNADAAAVRTHVLGRLGVAEDRTVVLYAPTYRDKLTTKTFAAARFDNLDLARLARLLGDRFTILVRGHNNNQRELDRVTGVAQVVDVTDYPDINELTLAADVAVLDYSSLRFDWAITGKPMVFFVPDIDDYFALREPLFPYEGTAPGPWCDTTEEVAAQLADLGRVRQRYAADVQAFNDRFNGLHDGKATARVLDAFFGIERGA